MRWAEHILEIKKNLQETHWDDVENGPTGMQQSFQNLTGGFLNKGVTIFLLNIYL